MGRRRNDTGNECKGGETWMRDGTEWRRGHWWGHGWRRLSNGKVKRLDLACCSQRAVCECLRVAHVLQICYHELDLLLCLYVIFVLFSWLSAYVTVSLCTVCMSGSSHINKHAACLVCVYVLVWTHAQRPTYMFGILYPCLFMNIKSYISPYRYVCRCYVLMCVYTPLATSKAD